MNINGPLDLVVALLLVVVRIGAFLSIAPPFASRTVPVRVRTTLAFAMALPVAPQLVKSVPTGTSELLGAVAFQAASGLVMGFIMMTLFMAIQVAGELVDLFGMFTMASILDPISNVPVSMFGRVKQLVAVTLLFASNGHLIVIRGLLSSFEAAPLRAPDLGQLASLMVTNVGRLVVAAMEIAAPMIVVLFIADIALGLISRAVPTLNVFQLSFPVKTIMVVTLSAMALAAVPGVLNVIVDRVVSQYQPVARLRGG